MKKSRFSEEQIIGILKEQQAGVPVAEICRKHGISDATFYTWRSRRVALSHSFLLGLTARTQARSTNGSIRTRLSACPCPRSGPWPG